MDPVVLSTLTAAVTVLGTEVGKATASAAGKTAWQAILQRFGWSQAPPPAELPERIAEKLQAEPELALPVLEHLNREEVGTAATLVARIDAEKVVVAHTIHGGVQM